VYLCDLLLPDQAHTCCRTNGTRLSHLMLRAQGRGCPPGRGDGRAPGHDNTTRWAGSPGIPRRHEIANGERIPPRARMVSKRFECTPRRTCGVLQAAGPRQGAEAGKHPGAQQPAATTRGRVVACVRSHATAKTTCRRWWKTGAGAAPTNGIEVSWSAQQLLGHAQAGAGRPGAGNAQAGHHCRCWPRRSAEGEGPERRRIPSWVVMFRRRSAEYPEDAQAQAVKRAICDPFEY